MKNKIVKHIANEALHDLLGAEGEVRNMKDKYPVLQDTRTPGIGLDMQVLHEKLKAAEKILRLLT